MKPRSAKRRFLKRLEAAGHPLATLAVAAGVEAMLVFYAEERAEGCDIEDDGDMLLFQWGTNDWGDGEAFEVNITRQFLAGDEDDEPRQLSLTFRFDPAAALCKLRDGNRWCGSPGELGRFRRFVTQSAAFKSVGRRQAIQVSLRYNRV